MPAGVSRSLGDERNVVGEGDLGTSEEGLADGGAGVFGEQDGGNQGVKDAM